MTQVLTQPLKVSTPSLVPAPREVLPRVLTWLAAAVFTGWCVAFVLLGQVNADEGWYLYASRLVYQGQLPWRDFVYTQMPLLPYLYGLPQAIAHGSVALGRCTSVALSLAALALAIRTAGRHGRWPAAVTAVLLAAFVYGLYYTSIVKTYALLALLLTAAVWALTSNFRAAVRYPLAALLAVLAAEARLSAAVPAAVVGLYCLWRAPNRARVLVVLVGAAAVAVPLWLYMQAPESAQYSLVGHHVGHWRNATLGAKAVEVGDRVVKWLRFIGPMILLAVAAVAVLRLANRRGGTAANAAAVAPLHDVAPAMEGRRREALVVSAVAVASFWPAHFASGKCYLEYFVPAVFAMSPLVGVLAGRAIARAGRGRARVAMLAALVAAAAWWTVYGVREQAKDGNLSPTWPPRCAAAPVAEIQRLAQPGRPVIAMDALWMVVQADREVPPGMALSFFSLQDMSDQRARATRSVNPAILAGYLSARLAPVVVLTPTDDRRIDGDRDNPGIDRQGVIRHALDANYQLLPSSTDRVRLYVPR